MAEDSAEEMQRRPLLTGWMIVVIVLIVALAAIGITALITKTASNITATSTTMARAIPTTAPPTKAVAPTSAVPVTTTTSASLTNFVDTWYLHDGELIIAANGAGTISVPGLTYAGCSQSAQIQVSPVSANTALATISSINAPVGEGCPSGSSGLNPSGGGGANENLTDGSTITLTFGPPGVQTSMGINYCDQSHAAQQVCGA